MYFCKMEWIWEAKKCKNVEKKALCWAMGKRMLSHHYKIFTNLFYASLLFPKKTYDGPVPEFSEQFREKKTWAW